LAAALAVVQAGAPGGAALAVDGLDSFVAVITAPVGVAGPADVDQLGARLLRRERVPVRRYLPRGHDLCMDAKENGRRVLISC
jgi:hypothetical protein